MRIPSQVPAVTLLDRDWRVCALPAGACAGPEDLEALAPHWVPTRVPATAAASLREAKQWSLDGPSRDFDAEDWCYHLTVDFPAACDPRWSALCFEGLATLCEVWLNGRLALRTANMFVEHRLPLEGLIQPGRNELHLFFRSLGHALLARRPRPRWRVPMIAHQQLRWFRTTVLGRTPGWSPPAAPVGPWRRITLMHDRREEIEVLQLGTTLREGRGTVRFRARCGLPDLSGGELRIVSDDRLVGSTALTVDGDTLGAELVLEGPSPWWPHTHGSSTLYQAVLHLRGGDEAIHEVPLGRIGFRRIELERPDPDDFRLAVNGVPVFCRGACWTPLDVVSLTASGDSLREALLQVRESGMNMLRLSGAFVYEQDAFHDLCDELGILVWQEFMFASMDYPGENAAFRADVIGEATQHARRWARHPSVAVICGNSEVAQQAAMWGTPRSQWEPPLFGETLRAIAIEHCPESPWWPSSAAGGPLPHQPGSGTASYYGVGAYLRPLSDLRLAEPRFCTESLGFANVPEAPTLALLGPGVRVHHPTWKNRSPRDLGAGWDFDDVRDHYLRDFFGEDPLALRYSDHDRYLELSRRVPGVAMRAAFSEWRRASARCGGALVWFLRDLWPGAGWGIVDSTGKPKEPWYALKDVLQPRWLGITDEGLNGLRIHLVNEPATPLAGTLDVTCFRDGEHVVARGAMPLEVAPRSAAAVDVAALLGEFHDLSFAYRFGPRGCDLVMARFSGADGTGLQCLHLPDTRLHVRPDPRCVLAAKARRVEDRRYELRISASSFARSIHIEAEGWHSEDLYFSLAPGASRSVWLTGDSGAPRPPFGFVRCLNAPTAARIEIEP